MTDQFNEPRRVREAIADRFFAGDSVAVLSADYGIRSFEEIEQIIRAEHNEPSSPGAPVSCSTCDRPLTAIAKADQDPDDRVVRHYAPCDCWQPNKAELSAAVAETLRRADELDALVAHDRRIVEAAETYFGDDLNPYNAHERLTALEDAVRAKRSAEKGR